MSATERDHQAALEVLELCRKLDVPIEDMTAARFREHGGSVSNGRWGLVKRLAAGEDERDAATPLGHHVKGVSVQTRDAAGRLVWIKTDRDKEAQEAALRAALEALPETVPTRRGTVTPPQLSASADDLLAVIPVGDAHVGMLAWGKETGDDDWDLQAAERVMVAAAEDLASHQPRARQALLVNVGDWYHSDSQANRTARSGHQLDVDSRWAKSLRVGVRIMVAMIDATLATHEEVRVVNLAGNHDDHSSVMLSVGLDAYYRNEPRVSIDLSPAMHRYHRFGRCLLGMVHGHAAKGRDLPGIMATDRPEDWGQTEHRRWITGHVHSSHRTEYRGCIVESFQTLTAPDAYAAGAGYRSGRSMHRLVLHREYGEIARTITTPAILAAMEAA